MSIVDWALKYRAYGYHPIPCRPRTKIPMVKWEPFQEVAPTEEQIRQWWIETPDANLALVMGRGCYALDFDGDGAEALLPADITLPATAPRSRTGSGGQHVLLNGYCGDRVGLFSTDGHKPQIDVRGVGIIVVPPSIHPNGRPYVWEIPPPRVAELPAGPGRLVALIAQAPDPAAAPTGGPQRTVGESWVEQALRGVPEGQRDQTCTRLAGYFLQRGLPADVTIALLCESFARNCAPVFPERDVVKTVRSIAKRETATGEIEQSDLRPRLLRDVLTDLVRALDAGKPQMVATPFHALNHCLSGGFAPGELIYLGARPGVGKTALALEMARRAARGGTPVLFVSREMVNRALAVRMVAQDGHVSASALRAHSLSADDYHAFSESLCRLGNLPVYLCDEAVSVGEIASLIGQTSAAGAWGLVVVDYLQMVRAPREVKERRLQVESVSQALKTLAVQFQVPVLCLSSLSRPPQGNPKPTLASLRESGELEHDADVVLLLHRPDEEAPTVECEIAKNRNGFTGHFSMTFLPEWVAFEEQA